ncbi:MAG: DUF3644 domain-containing protein [Lactobacillus delbrueckii]|jgi:hypothetical protein|uniref:DUF3644 domain-containing protein n=1 Tax=Lactobacillus delbrueckii TaxID=1584 RepID=UPI000230EADC|nr:DUF3644 domain-containing protein [Lactobacillus delbrueckii]EHE90459.1 hypothetical protein LDBUL1519_00679 [Lactobacillus delbrueckii subsp. bulgaricus CNCM I-1519]MCD5449095.1 DUF3644 domain-containing protein [Lactobacillus delbrueckii subsp. bulgaricus]MCH5408875.1 DUF3644 domain-containing protein [Lactobacillus delbrueckii]MCT3469490.1 DUF3644 domain-containing protein [Lactobacillus delbrueckii subsp. bulgaricus]MEC3724156.1 DUF3644 domain-containing protein [Lactobacillus delbrueck
MENLSNRLVGKSVEAFIMGLEIYNKPTIRYRVEGFSFFICNAWELMLKAYLINRDGETSIYYADKADRTISLEESIKRVFTNKHDPLRLNLEQIISLRNTSTHFITEDYEQIFAPLFQACVFNYVEKMQEFHTVDVSKNIAPSFLSLSVNVSDISDKALKANYSAVVAERMIRKRNEIAGERQEEGAKYSIPIETRLVITKDPNKADFAVNVSKTADTNITIVRDIKDPNTIFTFAQRKVIDSVNKRLKKKHILLHKIKNGELVKDKFTSNDFQLFIKFYDIKNKESMCYHYNIGNRYGYSQKVVDFIIDEIEKNDSIILHIKQELLKAKK